MQTSGKPPCLNARRSARSMLVQTVRSIESRQRHVLSPEFGRLALVALLISPSRPSHLKPPLVGGIDRRRGSAPDRTCAIHGNAVADALLSACSIPLSECGK